MLSINSLGPDDPSNKTDILVPLDPDNNRIVWPSGSNPAYLPGIRHEIADQEAAEAEALAAGREPPEHKMDGLLGKAHFEEAMKTARKSVSKTELARYLKFKKELSGGGSLKAASQAVAAEEAGEGGGSSEGGAKEEGDDELYD